MRAELGSCDAPSQAELVCSVCATGVITQGVTFGAGVRPPLRFGLGVSGADRVEQTGEGRRLGPECGGGDDIAHLRRVSGGRHPPTAVRDLALDHRWPQIALAALFVAATSPGGT